MLISASTTRAYRCSLSPRLISNASPANRTKISTTTNQNRTKSNKIEQNRTKSNTPNRQNHHKIFHFCPPPSHDPQQYAGQPREFPAGKPSPETPSPLQPRLMNTAGTGRTRSVQVEQDRTESNTPNRQNHHKIFHFCPPPSHDPQQYAGQPREFPAGKPSPETPSPLQPRLMNTAGTGRTRSVQVEQDRTESNMLNRQNNRKILHFCPPPSHDPQEYAGQPCVSWVRKNFSRTIVHPAVVPFAAPRRRHSARMWSPSTVPGALCAS